eukprot:TRINITY_DN76764_c0_g1_i1.p1 TRINITY_DN76764_c0_g1~~TRINITY_DN76764_c0_g1_i1.p1  ORF type:complete len:323 (-),score=106.64 TRINITY_DN76764_c0_g1_i1:226-1107(-)
MEADDLDSLIADSLGGVQSALEGERKAPAAEPAGRSAGEAVKELQQGPGRTDGQPAGEAFFSDLVKSLQDEGFQKAMADAMQGVDDSKPAGGGYGAEAPAVASSSSVAGSADSSEDFLQNFLKSFDNAVGSDSNFEKQLTNLMASMLSPELITEPLQQIADLLEPWLKNKKGLAKAERNRYEAQLRLYKQILDVYKQHPDPLPDSAREQVQRMLQELHQYGALPEEVMSQITPKDAEEGSESFEDFMKSMGLDSNLGTAEQDLLKKLEENPEELTKVMKDMAEGMPDEACKQQ